MSKAAGADAGAPVIDMWAPIVPSREIAAHVAEHYPPVMHGYLRVFFGREANAESFKKMARTLARDDEAILASFDAAGIRQTLITGFDEALTAESTFVSNESVAAIAGRHPDRFIPFAGIDILRGAEGVRELERWIRERGFRGLSLRPFMIGLPAADRRYPPDNEKSVELGVPVSMHASANWTTGRPSDLGHPRHFDAVACDFPELRLILSHGGYPWVLEACLLAWKHQNLFIELAAHRPRYFASADWEPLLRLGQTKIQDKVLYGTGAFLLGRAPADLVAEFRALPVGAEVMEKWLWRNAAQLMGLGPLA